MTSAKALAVGSVKEGEHLWSPGIGFSSASNIAKFQRWLKAERHLEFSDYQALWEWSVTEVEAFWQAIWDYFEVVSSTPYSKVLDSRSMPGTKWFEGSRVNYAEHMLRWTERVDPDKSVFYSLTEDRPLSSMSWRELAGRVRKVATFLRKLGVQPGDRVVSYMPNTPECAIAMMATVAIGAVWSSSAPEFGAKTVIDRFSQIKPKVLFAGDGYRFGGKAYDRRDEIREIVRALPSLDHIIWFPNIHEHQVSDEFKGFISWEALENLPEVAAEEFQFERVDCEHPLWIVYSSGTTGLPKAIVHSHVGMLVEHLKLMNFHIGLHPDSVMFFYTTTGWMMWNIVLASLLVGASAVLYDGNPAFPEPDVLWKMAAETGTTSFGASPGFVQGLEKLNLAPGEKFDLSKLESVVLGGAPATPETFEWFYRCVKKDLWVTSQSGGTDLCSALVGASPTLPVYAGEIQTRLLGMDVHAWSDAGEEIFGEVGELVVTKPFPSMPIKFWNDEGNRKYLSSYFDTFPNVWRHGDFIKINQRGGCYIYGRSDSTLNRFGVRIGTAEIYRTVEQVGAVSDSLIVCCESKSGQFFMPLFISLKPNMQLDEELKKKIKEKLRSDCSPRHVPDAIFAVPSIPYTLTGKKLEVPVRKILMGTPPEKAVSKDAMRNPDSLDWYVRFGTFVRDRLG